MLVATSTFPAGPDDHVPAFVRDQIIAWKSLRPSLRFAVLAPREDRADTPLLTRHAEFDEYRFRYAWPKRVERLAGRGILPQLKANPLYWLTVPSFVVAEIVGLLRITRRLRPKLIYAHWFTPQAIAAAVVGRLTGTPFVFTSHAHDAAVLGSVPLAGRAIARWVSVRATAATFDGVRTRRKLEALLKPGQAAHLAPRFAVMPMGTDPALLARTRPSGSRGTSPTLVFLGRLAEKKGCHYLLAAFARVADSHPDARLVIAGDGPWRDRLERQARTELGLDERQVRFLGYTTGEAKRDLLASADVYVLPSITADSGDAEGLPVSLLEGLAAGAVCIATASSGADEVISDGENGLLIDERSVEALVTALRCALTMGTTDRAAIRKGARETAERFVWPNIAREHYDHLLAATLGPLGRPGESSDTECRPHDAG